LRRQLRLQNAKKVQNVGRTRTPFVMRITHTPGCAPEMWRLDKAGLKYQLPSPRATGGGDNNKNNKNGNSSG